MRIHRMLAESAAGVLAQVFNEGRVLDRELDGLFRANPKWGKRDRGFIAETAFEVTRWRRALGFLAGDESIEALCAVQWVRSGFEVPEWWPSHPDEISSREAELSGQPRAIRESIPDWLDELGERELGDAWGREVAALNRRAPVFLRVNRLRMEVGEAIAWLGSHGIEASRVEGTHDALVLPAGKTLPKPLAAEGLVEIQDAGSQRIAPLLDLEPGMRVIDACAGAGGKALHLAALLQSKGEIVAMDISTAKLSELRRRASRAGTRIIRTEMWREDTLKRYAGWADRVLIDAPCSGLGTLRRQPDLKWRLTAPSLEKTKRLQRRMLDHYPELLRPGGKFVYATCSVLPSENGGQLRNLVERDARRAIEQELTVSPAETGWDGFYAARLG
ncbi:RsmB/NOP family class I SAM-dependent RNA methyltransferase [Luteolibacter soli]|uniref:RsmB/NOP family class I SAM-dependent RNA methyltransferase n=1 Tax=Luteolibacter soli TaxID=3135280 RepID=A0ABU9ASR9_9BACT